MDYFILDSWLLAEPIFNNPAVFVPAFKRIIQPGHLIKVYHDASELVGCIIATSLSLDNNNNEAHHAIPGQQRETNLHGLVKVNWYATMPSFVFSNPLTASPPSNVYLPSNIELLQTKSSSWIDTSLIKECVFMVMLLTEHFVVRE